MWTCAFCGEANPTGASRCEVCDQPAATAEAAPAPVHPDDTTVPFPAPPPATDPEPEPDSRGRPVVKIAAAVLLVAAVLAGILLTSTLLRPDPAPTPAIPAPPPATSTTTTDPDPTGPSPSPSPEITDPAAVGLVTIDPAVTDPRATEIATMFDTYFAGINDKDYDAVARVLDPAGVIDPTDPAQMAALQEGTRTTRNSGITLLRIGDGADGTRAEVTFRSNQDPGAGPKGRTDETCTRWRIDYTLTGAGAGYRILRGTARSQPC